MFCTDSANQNIFESLGFPPDRKDWSADSTIFQNELPLLLNPELDQPEAYFDFFPAGHMDVHMDVQQNNDRGRKTIEICDLNREELRIARKRLVDDFFIDLVKQADIVIEKLNQRKLETKEAFMDTVETAFKTLINKISDTRKPDHEHSRLGWFMANDFRNFLLKDCRKVHPEKLLHMRSPFSFKNNRYSPISNLTGVPPDSGALINL